jgi:hypothetical protein
LLGQSVRLSSDKVYKWALSIMCMHTPPETRVYHATHLSSLIVTFT